MGNSVFFLCCCWSTVRMWLGNLENEKLPSFTSSSPHVSECAFRNPRNFCWWNPESGKLLVESGILGFGTRNPSKDLNPEPKFYWQRPESSTWNPEFTAWNPESKTVLDSLTWDDRADVQLNETLLVTDVLSSLLCQNVRTTGVSTAEAEGLRIAATTTIIVIAVLALDGSVSRGLPAQEWQHHVHLPIGVVPIIPAGYMVDTPQ